MLAPSSVPVRVKPRIKPISEQECPQCHAMMPVYKGYVVWCEKCDWNLEPHKEEPAPGILNAQFRWINKKFGKWLGQALFARLAKAPELKSGWNATRVAAVVLSLVVHLITIWVAVTGLGMLFAANVPLWVRGEGLLFLATAWHLCPKFRKLEEDTRILSRSEYQNTHKVIENIAAATGAKPPDYIVASGSFNAAVGTTEVAQKRVLYLGLPLVRIMRNDELTALLAHEFGHSTNNDPSRSIITYTAVNTLIKWANLLRPVLRLWGLVPIPLRGLVPLSILVFLLFVAFSRLWLESIYLVITYTWITLIGFLILSRFAVLCLYGLALVIYQDTQKAEYLADAQAARVGGTNATLSMLDKLHFSTAYRWTVQNIALYKRGDNMFNELRERILEVPQIELERIRRVEKLTGSRLYTTHPPTVYRIELLRKHYRESPEAPVSDEAFALMRAELASLEPIIQADILDQYDDSIYA